MSTVSLPHGYSLVTSWVQSRYLMGTVSLPLTQMKSPRFWELPGECQLQCCICISTGHFVVTLHPWWVHPWISRGHNITKSGTVFTNYAPLTYCKHIQTQHNVLSISIVYNLIINEYY